MDYRHLVSGWIDRIVTGDALGTLREMPDECVHCCVTAPPGFNLQEHGKTVKQIGLENAVDRYVQHLVLVFREVRRVLHPSGTLWFHLPDTYDRGQVIFVAHRVALALQQDGWRARSNFVWEKPNAMPEGPVKNRPHIAHEQCFILSKNERYFYDWFAVREDATTKTETESSEPVKRQRRTVWSVTTKPTSWGHTSSTPEQLVEIMVKAGSSEDGCCPACGTPWVRKVKLGMEEAPSRQQAKDRSHHLGKGDDYHDFAGQSWAEWRAIHPDVDLGFTQCCSCAADDPMPCLVLDPFGGTGTTAIMAAKRRQPALRRRHYVTIDTNPSYVEIIEERLRPVREWENAHESFLVAMDMPND
jgi:site-specific DNA-methyltransferase (adenine-specific)